MSSDATHHFAAQGRMNFFDEQVPPELQEVLEMIVASRSIDLSRDWIEVLDPRLSLANEMKDFDILVVSKRFSFVMLIEGK